MAGGHKCFKEESRGFWRRSAKGSCVKQVRFEKVSLKRGVDSWGR